MSSQKVPHTTPDREPERWRSNDGQVLVMFAAGLILLLGMVALSVDGGFIMAEKRQVQSAADAGALAAAKAKLDYKYQPAAGNLETVQVEAGKNYGAENADTSEDDVVVDTAPSPLGEDYVEVTVSKGVDMFFVRALYDGEWGVSATAIAGMEPVQLPYALVALRECDPANPSGIAVNGSGTIDVNEGSIMSNCNIERSGDSSIIAADGAIDANGTIDPGTQWDAGQGFREGRPAISDPIVEMGVQPPDKSQMMSETGHVSVPAPDSLDEAVTNLSGGSGDRCQDGATCVMQPGEYSGGTGLLVRTNGTLKLEPGFYGGDITLDIRNTGTLQFEPGTYYFGDDFQIVQQGDARVHGTDVMVYITDNALWDPGQGRVEIAAPDTSPYADGLDGMALWIENCSDFRLQANDGAAFSGVVYAPCSSVTLSGAPGARGMQVVVGNLELSGSGDFDIDYEEYVMFDVPAVFLVQ